MSTAEELGWWQGEAQRWQASHQRAAASHHTSSSLPASPALRVAASDPTPAPSMPAGVRNFALCEGGREPLLLLTLLCPYLTLQTNRPPPCAAAAGEALPRSRTHGAASSGVATDAIKVMWATLGPATEGVPKDEPEAAAAAAAAAATAAAAAAAAAWRQWVEDGSMMRLHLLEGECAEVLDWLRVAALALPPSTRRVGAFNVGHMPIVPSWD